MEESKNKELASKLARSLANLLLDQDERLRRARNRLAWIIAMEQEAYGTIIMRVQELTKDSPNGSMASDMIADWVRSDAIELQNEYTL